MLLLQYTQHIHLYIAVRELRIRAACLCASQSCARSAADLEGAVFAADERGVRTASRSVDQRDSPVSVYAATLWVNTCTPPFFAMCNCTRPASDRHTAGDGWVHAHTHVCVCMCICVCVCKCIYICMCMCVCVCVCVCVQSYIYIYDWTAWIDTTTRTHLPERCTWPQRVHTVSPYHILSSSVLALPYLHK